jgi:2-dehydropantoate 2-reductase
MAELIPRPEWRQVILGCMREIEAVARAAGINLDPGIVTQTIDYIEGSLAEMHASMHGDILAGRPLELENLNGAVVRAGVAAGVPTPINDVIYAMLKPHAQGR